MCGIAGIVSLEGRPVSRDELGSMCDVLAHRGPDDEGYYLGTSAGLGMRRLSIIDLKTGRQPVSNEDGSIWVVFNGEIYNFKDLRQELLARGHSFYTATDTETIVHLYEEYGTACVQRMRGMFAFAVWDERRRELFLARDRLGIKPLYYAEVDGRLLFASELKALLQLPEIDRRLNWGAVHHLFTSLYTPRSESIIEGVRKLAPGHWLAWKPEHPVRVEQYWDVSFEPDYSQREGCYADQLRELLEESVDLHLVSDVPVGAFLSGGIDSSSVVAAAARLTAGPVKTFSIGFTEREHNELDHARRVSSHFGTEHHELVLEPDALGIVEDLAWHLDEPFGDPSAIPTYMVSKLASEHVKVVLSGDGGDELFAGYDKYLVERKERNYRFIPKAVRKALGFAGDRMTDGMRGRNFLRHIALDGAERYRDATTLFKNDERRRLFQPEAFEMLSQCDPCLTWAESPAKANGAWLSALQYQDLKSYLPLDILTKVDRMSMAHSIETRVPLLDHKLVEFAATIPPEFQLRGRTTKNIFKRSMRGILPDEIIDRPKHGFSVPLGGWFRGRLNTFIRDLLLSEQGKRRGIFNPAYVEELLRRNQKGRDLDFQLWTLISFELWCRTFLDQAVRRPAPVTVHDRMFSAGSRRALV